MLSVAISTRRVQSLSLRSLMDCVASPARVAASVTWWLEGPWCWSGNDLANGASTCSKPDDIGCSGCSGAPPRGTPPAGDASPSGAGYSRGLPHSEVPNSSPRQRTVLLNREEVPPCVRPSQYREMGQALQPLGALLAVKPTEQTR